MNGRLHVKSEEWGMATVGAAPESEVASSPAHLIAQAQAGDPQAFERLMSAHQGRVFRMAMGMLAHREDAKDACQEVFIRLFKYLRRLDAERPVEPWLFRVTVNVCKTLARRRKRRAMVPLDEAATGQADPGATPARPRPRRRN